MSTSSDENKMAYELKPKDEAIFFENLKHKVDKEVHHLRNQSPPSLLPSYEKPQEDYDEPNDDVIIDEYQDRTVTCPICDKALGQYYDEEKKELRFWCQAGCRLPWTSDSNEFVQMLSLLAVTLLPYFKIDDDNPKLPGPPRCTEHGITCQLTWYRYRHMGNRQKQDQDPNFKNKKLIHKKFFWICGLQTRKYGGQKCNFTKSADTPAIKGQNMTKLYSDIIMTVQRNRELKTRAFSNEYFKHLEQFQKLFNKESRKRKTQTLYEDE